MKILATTDTSGGVFTTVVGLARALVPHGVETIIAATGGGLSESRRREVLEIPGAALYEAPFRPEWMDDPWDDVARAGWWLEGLARGLRPDVIHLNGYAHGALDLDAPKLMTAHSDVLSWWRAVKRDEAPSRYDRYRDVVAAGLQGADIVLAPTRAYLDEVEALYGAHRDSHVVPNATAMPVRLRRPSKVPLVLGAGRLWNEAKNLTVLDRVAEAVDWPVYLAGDTRHPDGVARSVGHAHLLGQLTREALAGWMDRSAVLCHPALYEPFGLVPLEAASAGCALVLGDIPTLREVWGDAACYVAPRDPVAVTDALREVTETDALRARLARAAQARARRYDPAAQARSILSLYRQLSPAPRTGRRTATLHPGSP